MSPSALVGALRVRGLYGLVERHAKAYLTTPHEVCGRGRPAHVVAARHAVWRELRGLGWSYPAIGQAFGRDHTTVLNALRSMPQVPASLPKVPDLVTEGVA